MTKRLNSLIEKGGDLIANRVMLQPDIDKQRGELADKKRTAITRKRESRVNDKAQGY